jgi:hypothetical protein
MHPGMLVEVVLEQHEVGRAFGRYAQHRLCTLVVVVYEKFAKIIKSFTY